MISCSPLLSQFWIFLGAWGSWDPNYASVNNKQVHPSRGKQTGKVLEKARETHNQSPFSTGRNLANQLRLVVHLIIYGGLISGGDRRISSAHLLDLLLAGTWMTTHRYTQNGRKCLKEAFSKSHHFLVSMLDLFLYVYIYLYIYTYTHYMYPFVHTACNLMCIFISISRIPGVPTGSSSAPSSS